MAHVTIETFIDWLFLPKTPKHHYHDMDFALSGLDSFGITTDQNNYEPNPAHDLSSWRLTPSTSGIDITGIVPGDVSPIGRILIIHNVSVTQALTLKHANTSSSAKNRIECPGDVDYRIGPNSGVVLWYDGALIWRILDGGYVPLQPFFTTVINELGFNVDWRMEGLNNINLVLLDASLDALSLGGVNVAGSFLTIEAGAQSRAHVTDVGVALHMADESYTDSGNATLALWSQVNLGVPAIVNTTGTLADASNLYIGGPPTISGGGAITNTYALFVDAGIARFDGDGTDIFEFPADATDPTSGGGAATGRIAVKIGGSTFFLAYY